MQQWLQTSGSGPRRRTSAARALRSPRSRHETRERAIVAKTKKQAPEEQLSEEEIEKAHAERLPHREQMSVIKEPYPFLPVDPGPGQYSIEPVPPEEV